MARCCRVNDMEHFREAAEGVAALSFTWIMTLWTDVHPLITAVATICGFILAVHGVWNLVRGRPVMHVEPHDDHH